MECVRRKDELIRLIGAYFEETADPPLESLAAEITAEVKGRIGLADP